MIIRMTPLVRDLLTIQNICDSMDIELLLGAGLPTIDGVLNGFDKDNDNKPRPENYTWCVAYLKVETVRQAEIVLARLKNSYEFY